MTQANKTSGELIKVTRDMVQRYIAWLVIFSVLLGIVSFRAEYKDNIVIEFTGWPEAIKSFLQKRRIFK